MAAKEAIHFPLWTQLGPHLAVPLQILFDPVSLFPPNLLPKRRYTLKVAGCPCSLLVTKGRSQLKLGLFQRIVELNHLFERLNISLKELESVPFFHADLIRHARSDVEIARVYANREFFDNFEKIVEDDAKWAYRFQQAFDEKLRDRDDIYLEVRSSEERRKRKGLPPRVVVLPGWELSDEDRFDERRARQGKTSASKTTRTARTPSKESRPQTRGSPRLRTPKKGKPTIFDPRQFVPAGNIAVCAGVRSFDKTEPCWRIATRMTIKEGDLSDWKSGDFKQLRLFFRNQRDWSA